MHQIRQIMVVLLLGVVSICVYAGSGIDGRLTPPPPLTPPETASDSGPSYSLPAPSAAPKKSLPAKKSQPAPQPIKQASHSVAPWLETTQEDKVTQYPVTPTDTIPLPSPPAMRTPGTLPSSPPKQPDLPLNPLDLDPLDSPAIQFGPSENRTLTSPSPAPAEGLKPPTIEILPAPPAQEQSSQQDLPIPNRVDTGKTQLLPVVTDVRQSAAARSNDSVAGGRFERAFTVGTGASEPTGNSSSEPGGFRQDAGSRQDIAAACTQVSGAVRKRKHSGGAHPDFASIGRGETASIVCPTGADDTVSTTEPSKSTGTHPGESP